MAAKRRKRANRYEVVSNVEAQFVDRDKTVLVNKVGATDAQTLDRLEAEALVAAYDRVIGEVRTDTRMSCDLLKHIHAAIFGDLYEWAGRWRTVKISKGGAIWPPPDYLDAGMAVFETTVLLKYPASVLQEDEAFCAAAGEIEGEFLAIHPFREGNARTIKLLVDLLALQTGRPLLKYDCTDAGRERYIAAARAAMGREYGPMTGIIRMALAAAKQR